MPGLAAEISDLKFSVRAAAPESWQTIVDIPELSLKPSKITAISGPSGASKSTLLYLLSGLLRPQSGVVRWGDVNLTLQKEGARDRWRREHAGFIFQGFNLIDELPPVDNVLLPAWFAYFSVGETREKARALLEQFGVPHQRGSVSLLSRGEQQRVAIARALLFDPEVVFADEPTASLDAAAGSFVAKTLKSLASEHGKTVVIASHDRNLLDLADQTVLLDHGRLVKTGRPASR